MDSLSIGNVIRVATAHIDVAIRTPARFLMQEDIKYPVGQLGTYVALPMGEATLIGFVTDVREQELTAVNVAPRLIMQVQLLGQISGDRFVRGVREYPLVGADVRVATRNDFAVIFGSFDEKTRDQKDRATFPLGRFALNPEFEVRVLGSEMFSKHVALIGNSGAGKSCTAAKILQEVIRAEQSQVVLFDLHGEYRAAFSDADGNLATNVTCLTMDDLVLPYWLLKYEEFDEIFVDRSNPLHINVQVSFLRTALLEFKRDAAKDLGLSQVLTLDTPIYFSLEDLKTYALNLNEARFILNEDRLAFNQLGMRSLDPDEQQHLMRTQRCSFKRGNPEGETPHPLYFGKLLGLIDQIETKLRDGRYRVMLRPFEHGLQSKFFREHLENLEETRQSSSLMNHLIRLLTGRMEPRSNLTIIDMSGLPFELVDITVAVLTRLLFDLNFWTPAEQRHPILLAYEEAHIYIPREKTDRCFAKRAVERVAKEGRKYGVSAMLMSQRPSELSETVLSQCNNFVAMRLSNPEDQRYISKIVGDHSASLISMLPILQPGEAFIIGDSVIMPMRTLVDMPDPAPQSGNVDCFKLWSSTKPTYEIDEVINHWRRQDRKPAAAPSSEPPVSPLPKLPVRGTDQTRADPFARPQRFVRS